MITGLDCYEKFGDPFTRKDEGEYMTLWEVPEYIWSSIPTIPRKIYCNKQMVVPLETAFYDIIKLGLCDQIKTWDGCFNIRPIRGYEDTVKRLLKANDYGKAMIYLSVHSWGIAIDINAFENQLGTWGKMDSEVVQCFEDAGFEWGGDWKRKDPMHFNLKYLTE